MISPRLLDSFGRLDLMLRNINTFSLDIAKDLDLQKATAEHDKRLFRDKVYHDNFVETVDKVSASLEEYNASLTELKQYIQDNLRKSEVRLIQENYKNYESFSATLEERISLRKTFSAELNDYIYGLNNRTSRWEYAGVDLNPTDPEFTKEIIGSDPTYIVADEGLQQVVLKQFNEFYGTRRLRKYNKIEDLPDNSLGVAFCFGKYECMPIDPIKDEVSILFNKMLPGSKFYFTYNNCEYRASLEFCNGFRAYQTESIISSLLYSIGFDKVENVTFNDGTWNVMIVEKPGTLTTQKLTVPSVDIVKVIDSQSK